MDIAAASAAGLPAQTAALLTVAFITLAAWQRIDGWSAPKEYVKLVIPGKQGSSDDSETAQNGTLMFYARFPKLAPSCHTARDPKPGGKYSMPGIDYFPPIASRGSFPTPCPI